MAVTVGTASQSSAKINATATGITTAGNPVTSAETRNVYDASAGAMVKYRIVQRANLHPADTFNGPAIIAEEETSTVVPSGFSVVVDAGGALVLTRQNT